MDKADENEEKFKILLPSKVVEELITSATENMFSKWEERKTI